MNKEEILKIIDIWKLFWMNPSQNTEDNNYFNIAIQIDANMCNHLSELIEKRLKNEKNN